MIEVTHLTSAHPRNDIRIFVKMCRSLAKNDKYKVNLVVADGLGFQEVDKVNIYDVGERSGSRFSRMTKTVSKVYKKAKKLDSAIYHLHDPELLPVARKLKKLGKVVIFDAHEDLPKQILGKPYLNKFSKILLSNFFAYYEKFICKHLDAVITATPIIRDKFSYFCKTSIDINNFPFMDELYIQDGWDNKAKEICYIGGIDVNRGIREVVDAMSKVKDCSLNLAGKFSEEKVENEINLTSGWERVNYLGQIERKDLVNVLGRSMAGLVTFLAVPNHINAQPNKMFEYMSAGLPVIGSDFSLWREIIVGYDCGVCVDPSDATAIARAIEFLLSNPQRAMVMGQNGRRAIEIKFNWKNEEAKLLALYGSLTV